MNTVCPKRFDYPCSFYENGNFILIALFDLPPPPHTHTHKIIILNGMSWVRTQFISNELRESYASNNTELYSYLIQCAVWEGCGGEVLTDMLLKLLIDFHFKGGGRFKKLL
jgi:hypothetical protein